MDHAAAITAARRALSRDELAEEMHRRLIALYSAVGDRTAALRQFEQCAAVLERELGSRRFARHALSMKPSAMGPRCSRPSSQHRPSRRPASLACKIGRPAPVASPFRRHR